MARKTVAGAIEALRVDRILPYRFITAARYAPDFEPELEAAMLTELGEAGRALRTAINFFGLRHEEANLEWVAQMRPVLLAAAAAGQLSPRQDG